MFRAAIDLISWEGLRPSEAAALRHHHWRDEHGPLPYIDVEKAVKDIRGHLLEDERQTATLHEPILWPAIAEELEGSTRPDFRTEPSTNGLDGANGGRARVSGHRQGPDAHDEGDPEKDGGRCDVHLTVVRHGFLLCRCGRRQGPPPSVLARLEAS